MLEQPWQKLKRAKSITVKIYERQQHKWQTHKKMDKRQTVKLIKQISSSFNLFPV